MRKKKVTLSIFLFLLITLLLFLHFITYRNCQTFKIFKATLDFGTEHVRGCFSQNAIQRNIRHYVKTYVSKSSLFYKFVVKYKHNFISKDYKFDNKIFENFGGLNYYIGGEKLNFSKVASSFPGQYHSWTDTMQIPRQIVRNWDINTFKKMYINKFHDCNFGRHTSIIFSENYDSFLFTGKKNL